MTRFEYKSIPAPKKGEKARGVKGSDARMAQAMTTALNDMSAKGWDYLRADTLPLEERSGIRSKTIHYYTVLVFRREIEATVEDASTSVEAASSQTDAPVLDAHDAPDTSETDQTMRTPRRDLTATRDH
ncbi:DUF4177 domain-containing protein [Celeribacter marinus]|uniref:DUF4177 domain-containing protein n=1 Tax=Celeribacter marinus TaxID=1397108 RepID=UPI003F6A58F2